MEGISSHSACPLPAPPPACDPLASRVQLTEGLSSIGAMWSHPFPTPCAVPSLQTLAVGLENRVADPSQRAQAEPCNHPGEGIPGCSSTTMNQWPEEDPCTVHLGVQRVWTGNFLLFPGSPGHAAPAWIHGQAGLKEVWCWRVPLGTASLGTSACSGWEAPETTH